MTRQTTRGLTVVQESTTTFGFAVILVSELSKNLGTGPSSIFSSLDYLPLLNESIPGDVLVPDGLP